jgi:hypothetical protein
VAKPNFNYQKRQKEIARQKKNEEKRKRKLERSAVANPAEGEQPSGAAAADQEADEAGGENQVNNGSSGQ